MAKSYTDVINSAIEESKKYGAQVRAVESMLDDCLQELHAEFVPHENIKWWAAVDGRTVELYKPGEPTEPAYKCSLGITGDHLVLQMRDASRGTLAVPIDGTSPARIREVIRSWMRACVYDATGARHLIDELDG